MPDIADLIPLTWGIEIPDDLAEFAETLFTELSNRRLCKLFVDEQGKCVIEVSGKKQVCLTASVTPKDYIDGIPPHLIRKLFDTVVANQALREMEQKIVVPGRILQ
jgi:hypothetical protein